MAKYKVFYAYPSKPTSLGETVEDAAKWINGKKQLKSVRIHTWRQMNIAGKVIIRQILQQISDAQIFACDLTHPNPNVIFELGYAIGSRKRVWISLDAHDTEAREVFRRLSTTLLPDVGYSTYANYQDLAEEFIKTKPWADIGEHLLGPGFSTKANRPPYYSLFYHAQPYLTNESLKLTEALKASAFSEGLFDDDPRENPSATLNWYAERIRDTDAVIVHLLSPTQDENAWHNLRCAFIAGLGCGLRGNVERGSILMLAPEQYSTPLDYRSILSVYDTGAACAETAVNWLVELQSRIPKKNAILGDRGGHRKPIRSILDLRVGEGAAENERTSLAEYFVPTGSFTMALGSEQAIFVGRRGTGKTATLYSLAREFGKSRGVHVCVINPVGYEIDGVVRALQQVSHRTEKGYLLESLWRLLIFSELAMSVAADVRTREQGEAHLLTNDELNLLKFVDDYRDILDVPFSDRVNRAIAPLLEVDDRLNPKEQRLKVSEYLHTGLIRELRGVLGAALSNRKKVAILIDNLDEPWAPGPEVDYLADLLSGLFKVARDIVAEFHHSDYWRRPVNASLVVFVRSDIFYHVRRITVEKDKLPLHILHWDNPGLLLQVIDKRLEHSTGGTIGAAEIWRTMFTESIGGMHPRDFLVSFTLPRPRHLIWFMQEAIITAINKQHTLVTEEDFYDARRRYSEFALTAIQAEDDPKRGRLKSVLMKFTARQTKMTRSEIRGVIGSAALVGDDVEFYVDLLCDLNFLGIETVDGFRYARDESERQLVRELAMEAAAKHGGVQAEESYEINRVFHDALQIR